MVESVTSIGKPCFQGTDIVTESAVTLVKPENTPYSLYRVNKKLTMCNLYYQFYISYMKEGKV